ncbi:MAG TPA: M23 family metallopeptidase [Candidatus Paceibacterota bacterium]
MLPKKPIPSLATQSPLVEKFKKALAYLLLAGGSSLGLFAPAVASAAFSFSVLLDRIVPQANASAPIEQNSQNMQILSAATNSNPNHSVGGGDISVVDNSALVAQDGPSGTPADIEARPNSSAVSVYVVRPGDNLSTIADMHNVSINTIKWANDLTSGTIHEGQTLVILPVSGIRHTVVKGDTVASLAKKYKADEDEILAHNDISGALVVGEEILIPNGTIATAPAPARKAVARSGSGAGATVAAGGPAISGYYAWPVAGGVITQGVHGYNGIDIGAPNGTPIYAAAAGTVVVAISNGGYNGGYGNYVVVQHQNGTQTLYAHMSRVLTTMGATVAQGANIGLVGSTGKSTGNHLHFEVRGAANPFAR